MGMGICMWVLLSSGYPGSIDIEIRGKTLFILGNTDSNAYLVVYLQ